MTTSLRPPKARDAIARICVSPDKAQRGDIIGVVQKAVHKSGGLALTLLPIDQFIVMGPDSTIGMTGWNGLMRKMRSKIAVDVLDLQSANIFTQIVQNQIKPLVEASEDEYQNFTLLIAPNSILAIDEYTLNSYIIPKAESSEESVSTYDIELCMTMMCDGLAESGHEKLVRARQLTLEAEIISTLYRVIDEDDKPFRLGTPDFFTPTEEKV
jgi:hypothetical protein